MKITPFFRWYDMYIGPCIDLENKAVYLVFLGLGLKFKWGETVHVNQKEIYSPDGSELWATIDYRPTYKPVEGTDDYRCVAEDLHIECKRPDIGGVILFYKGDPPKEHLLYTGKLSLGMFSHGICGGKELRFEMDSTGEILMLDLRGGDATFHLSQDLYSALARPNPIEAQLIIQVLE